ncbi:MAG TPA: Uma2 family endonuclease [Chloroflexota bacterium]|nr:Uma2 family endonuclease [Chloroflexota bacterium]
MFARVRAPIDYAMYPTSDGKPMAETEVHRVQMNDLIFNCANLLAAEPEVYVGGNMLMYYHEGYGRDHVSADVFVTFGVERGIRECWMTWEEGGRFADLVFEISSPSTIKEDLGKKMRLYAQLGVSEYYLYDPQRNNQPPLAGYQLVDGTYQPMTRLVGVEGYFSEVLGTELRVIQGWLRVIDPATGKPLLVPSELEAVRARAEAAREQAEAARDQAEAARKAAEERAEYEAVAHHTAELRAANEAAARQAAEAARQATEAALRQAMEEIARLRAAADQG